MLTSGGYCSTYGWQVGGMHPTGTFPLLIIHPDKVVNRSAVLMEPFASANNFRTPCRYPLFINYCSKVMLYSHEIYHRIQVSPLVVIE